PDSFEAAFGYRGNLRFVQFGYVAGSLQFGYSDGGDDLPSDASLWSWFLHHPVIAPHLPETRYPTLYGKFPSGSERPSLEQIMSRGADLPTCHCLLLDGMLISSGSEDYKEPPPRWVLEQIRRFMDGQVGGSQGA